MVKCRSKNQKLERKYFSNAANETVELPNLINVQLDSFRNFVEKGVGEVLSEKFPIQSNNDNYTLSYESHCFSEPAFAIEECKNHNKTFERALNVTLTLHNKTTGLRTTETGLLCKIPWMTDTGTFIIKGVERIIVNQLIRAPGAYYKKAMDKNGVEAFECDIHPQSGTYFQIETDAKKVIYVKIDKQKRILATVFFRALGLTNKEDFVKFFGSNEFVKATIDKDEIYNKTENNASNSEVIAAALKEVYEKVKPGEPMGKDAGIGLLRDKYFAPKRYDLGKTGRYKLKTKLSLYARMLNKYAADDIFDVNGEVVVAKGTYLDANVVDSLKEAKVFDNGGMTYELPFVDPRMESHKIFNMISVKDNMESEPYNLIGTEQNIKDKVLTIPDIFAAFNYFTLFLQTPETDPIGQTDDIDHLSNRKVKTVGELLQEKLGVGLTRLTKKILERMSTTNSDDVIKEDRVSTYLAVSIVNGVFDEFFSTSQLSQFMDQTNPLAELTNKRRLSALGPGGITRDRASMEVRDVHYSHYGRICPVETPEGPNVGLINNLCCFGRINEFGFIETPYRKVVKVNINGEDKYEVVSKPIYLTADDELDRNIADTSIELDEIDGRYFIKEDNVVVRYRDEVREVPKNEVHYVDVSPKQIVSIASACIPFLENNDGKRALMGANMQKQSVPLLRPSSPYVGTGVEERIAKDSGSAVLAKEDGTVTYVDGFKIVIKGASGELTYKLVKFERSNQCTAITQTPIVITGQKVKKGDIIADGPSMDNGEIALGQNVTVAFMTWGGYNFEDAVIMSERLVKDDIFTSVHIEEYECNCRQTQSNGQEEITADIGEIGAAKRNHLDENGIVVRGSRVSEGDILVGKKTPKGEQDNDSTNKLINTILEKSKTNMKNTSLTVPHGGDGIVIDTQILSKENRDELNAGILKTIKVYVAQKRKISEGDKMAGRYGNKGVISKIVPEEDMPFLPDGTPVDILLNPVGVPKRMNIGQVLELHLGAAAKKLGYKVASPVFDSITMEQISEMMKDANMDEDGKTVLYDGKTGEPYNERISVGVMYMIKLSHMVDDKIHARATGPYSLITQQPLGGKAQKGGQRFGEMEVWALEAYGAAYTLQEMMTIKSDDTTGRRLAYKYIEEGRAIPDSNMPECFKVMQKELKGLGLNCQIFDDANHEINLSEISLQSEIDLQEKARNSKESISLGKEFQSYEYEEILGEESGLDEEQIVTEFSEPEENN